MKHHLWPLMTRQRRRERGGREEEGEGGGGGRRMKEKGEEIRKTEDKTKYVMAAKVHLC